MLFPTLQFALFFGLTLLLHRSLPLRARSGILLGASLIFYALWIPPYLFLLLGDILVNYLFLQGIVRGRHKKLWLTASVVFTLGLLAGFKYAIPVLEGVTAWWGVQSGTQPIWPEVILPLGISFYSFQIIGFAVDAYRGEAGADRVPLARYALFISFFPQLVAGPILRGNEMLPQLERGASTNRARDRKGIRLLVWGLVKKVVLSDFLLSPFVNSVFASQGQAGIESHWVAIWAFAFQIYFDFSGYTDMARGLALLLGYELPDNFHEPYLSRGPAEFWRRWHITLSRWLRDYLYIPLGGNRNGVSLTYLNLIITMLLGGLWHGAGWTFIAWGGMHGAMLCAERALGQRKGVQERDGLGWADAPRIFIFFQLTCFSWVFFRAEDMGAAFDFYGGLFGASGSTGWPLLPTLSVLFCVALHPLERWLRTSSTGAAESGEVPRTTSILEAVVVGLALAVVVATSGTGAEFIYFQF
ncbi:MAG: MBOAT family O-acyltransferase [Myxococcota bacterium]|nr:MBOAT family O-acyltransferase [Myxococcota bacterium]